MLQAPLWLWLLQTLMLPARLTGSWESASREEDLASEHGSSWGMSLTIKVRVSFYLSLSSSVFIGLPLIFLCVSLYLSLHLSLSLIFVFLLLYRTSLSHTVIDFIHFTVYLCVLRHFGRCFWVSVYNALLSLVKFTSHRYQTCTTVLYSGCWYPSLLFFFFFFSNCR